KLLLIEIYTQTDSEYANPAEAVKWASELRVEYPNHPMIDFVEIVALYENKNYDGVITATDEFLEKVKNGEPFYKKIYMFRGLVAKATAYFAKKDWELAKQNFLRAVFTMADSKPPTTNFEGKPNRWAIWALVRLGQIEDILGNRNKAVEYYEKALSYEDHWGLENYIKDYPDDGYDMEEFPGQLPPP
ncbi:MAG TPA: tetratricopeptide repeat protein, partial [Elusimicrobiales bacterium]|nr:tetratricopeptide repeat protein [Elusimicrobiales bacterium]